MTTKIRSRFAESMSSAYVLGLLAVAGVFALISAVLISWPAVAYIGSKLI